MELKHIAMFVGWYSIALGTAELINQNTTAVAGSNSVFQSISSLPSLGGILNFGSLNAAYIDLIIGAALLWYAHGVKL